MGGGLENRWGGGVGAAACSAWGYYTWLPRHCLAGTAMRRAQAS